MSIRVLLVDDHAVVLKGLHYFLGTQTGIELIGEASNGEEALQKVKELLPDVVVMDLIMPVMNGIEATRQIKQLHPDVKVIVLTTFSDQDHVLPAIRAGANGYLLKDVQPEELVLAIRGAHSGQAQLHPRITDQLMAHLAAPEPAVEGASCIDSLTAREREILLLLAEGKSNKEIAAQCHITEKTVKTHVSHVLSKLELSDRTQAAIYAVKKGLTL
jgi:DNA-binding NarL/FixJ family response regulator